MGPIRQQKQMRVQMEQSETGAQSLAVNKRGSRSTLSSTAGGGIVHIYPGWVEPAPPIELVEAPPSSAFLCEFIGHSPSHFSIVRSRWLVISKGLQIGLDRSWPRLQIATCSPASRAWWRGRMQALVNFTIGTSCGGAYLARTVSVNF